MPPARGVSNLGPQLGSGGSERHVHLGAASASDDLLHQGVEVGGVFDEVDVIGVDHQQRCFPIVEEKVGIGLAQAFEVLGVDLGFIVPSALRDTFHQDRDRGLHVDHKIGLGHFLFQYRVQLLVDLEVVIAQVEIGEDPVFGKGVIGKHQVLEQIQVLDCGQASWQWHLQTTLDGNR